MEQFVLIKTEEGDKAKVTKIPLKEFLNPIFQLPPEKCENEKDYPEFTDEQIRRMDEINNAVYQLGILMTNKEDLEWDISWIGEIADNLATMLYAKGYVVYYPTRYENADGKVVISDFYPG